MKRIILIILTFILLLCACGGNDIAVNDLEGISMEIADDISNRAATVVISVDAYKRFVGNGEFFIQQLKNGKWHDVGGEKGISSALREDFGRGEEHSFYCVWDHVYGPLEQGHYRIVKEIYVGAKAGVGQLHYLAAEFDIGPEQMTEQFWVRDEAPYVSILSGGETIVPYFHFSFDYEWVAEYQTWLSADGTSLEFELPELAPQLPTVDYGEGFELFYNRDSSFYQLYIFNSEFECVYSGNEFSVLDDLEPGKYYIGISATVQGEYIPEGNDRERSGWVGVVALEKQ